MAYVAGFLIGGEDAERAAGLVRLGVAYLQRANGSVSPESLRLRDDLAMFARRSSAAQAAGEAAHASVAVSADAAASGATVTVAEAAARSGYSRQHVRRLCVSGVLLGARTPAGWAIDADSAAALAARRREHDD